LETRHNSFGWVLRRSLDIQDKLELILTTSSSQTRQLSSARSTSRDSPIH